MPVTRETPALAVFPDLRRCGYLLLALLILAPAGAAADWQRYCPADAPVQHLESRPLAFAQGRLWRIDAPGGGPPSWIFGTMHIADPRVTTLPPAAERAFTAARILRVETAFDAGSAQTYADRMQLDGDHMLNESLPAALYARYIEIAHDYGVGITQAARLRPWAAFNLIGRPPPGPDVVLDELLQQRARAAGVAVAGIESMAELVDALDGLAAPDQVAMLVDTLCSRETMLASLPQQIDRYLAGDLAALLDLALPEVHAGARVQRFLDAVLYQRSARMAERLQRDLQQGGAFVAVGALHLPGDRGLLQLLESDGFRVTPAQ